MFKGERKVDWEGRIEEWGEGERKEKGRERE